MNLTSIFVIILGIMAIFNLVNGFLTLKNIKKHVYTNSENLRKIAPEGIETLIRERINEVRTGLRADIESTHAGHSKRIGELETNFQKYTLRYEELESIARKHLNRANTREARAGKVEEMQAEIDRLQEMLIQQGTQEITETLEDEPLPAVPVNQYFRPKLVRKR